MLAELYSLESIIITAVGGIIRTKRKKEGKEKRKKTKQNKNQEAKARGLISSATELAGGVRLEKPGG